MDLYFDGLDEKCPVKSFSNLFQQQVIELISALFGSQFLQGLREDPVLS